MVRCPEREGWAGSGGIRQPADSGLRVDALSPTFREIHDWQWPMASAGGFDSRAGVQVAASGGGSARLIGEAGMVVVQHWLAISMMLVATASGAQSCGAGGGGSSGEDWSDSGPCRMDSGAITAAHGMVFGSVKATCDDPSRRPIAHTAEGWLEYRESDDVDWKPYESRLSFTIPDRQGLTILLSEPCRPGWWRTGWKAYGTISTPPEPRRFTMTPNHDFWATRIREC